MLDRRPDQSILERFTAISYESAATLLNIQARQLRHLIALGKLERVGAGQRRRVTSKSIRQYGGFIGPSEPIQKKRR